MKKNHLQFILLYVCIIRAFTRLTDFSFRVECHYSMFVVAVIKAMMMLLPI